jgi:hypothetical protein
VARSTTVVCAGAAAAVAAAGVAAAGVAAAGVLLAAVVPSCPAAAGTPDCPAGVAVGMVSVRALCAPVSVVALPVQPVAPTAHRTTACAWGPSWPAPANAPPVAAPVSARPESVAAGLAGAAPDEVEHPPVRLAQCAAPEASAARLPAGSPPALGPVPEPWPVEAVSHEPAPVWQPT